MLAFILNISGPVVILLAFCYFAAVMMAILTAIRKSEPFGTKLILVVLFVFIPFSAVAYLVWNKFNKEDSTQGSIE